MQAQDILDFWFEELTDKQHFIKDPALDDMMRKRFGTTLEAAARCELFTWRTTPQGRLAEILVLDQFSRNIWRDTARAFAQDSLALVVLMAALLTSGCAPLLIGGAGAVVADEVIEQDKGGDGLF